MKKLKRNVLISSLLSIGVIISGCGNEETSADSSDKFPEGPVKIVVPFSAGGGADTTARVIAEHTEEHLGVKIVTENRDGAGGTLGQEMVATAEPDGYTLGLITTSIVTNPIFNNVSYTHEDFIPIAQLVSDVGYLYIPGDAPYDDIESLIEYASNNGVTIAVSGAQTSDNFAAREFAEAAGIQSTPIPYEGGSRAVASAAGGHDDATISSFSEAEGQVQSGNLKPILVFSEERSEQYPDVPTSYEKGIEVTEESWRGIGAPSGTDPEIIKYLQEAFKKGFDDEKYQEKMKNQGMDTMYRNTEEFQKVINTNYERFKNAKE
ncbi:tripartite tricarboxylate transporter substrate binding protein [Paenisporosarcina antarctica]|uniref:Tripartite tricarboxylate transporter substrate binding protein n=1 Tax=Paenisporosarcina antarctica TaxID=417367 RepID=A0A4V1ANG7_9BACL|nr:tripartite tricarboxylate transporter substrate binding protein [Paenisporosarcina antarctica]QBP42715.1 tripartite tricarboxylate transporter substrate binding protein [Paenisporosarcina antarctica]